NASDVVLTNGLTLQSGPTVAETGFGSATVTVTVAGNQTGTVGLNLAGPCVQPQAAPGSVKAAQAIAPICLTFTSVLPTKQYTPAELRHMSDVPSQVVIRGDGTNGSPGVLVSAQDVVNNVRGSRHVVCTVAQNSGTSFFSSETPSNGGTLAKSITASSSAL